MKIFLTAINAKYIHSNLAVYSLRAYAKDYQDQIVIGEYTINNRVDSVSYTHLIDDTENNRDCFCDLRMFSGNHWFRCV